MLIPFKYLISIFSFLPIANHFANCETEKHTEKSREMKSVFYGILNKQSIEKGKYKTNSS